MNIQTLQGCREKDWQPYYVNGQVGVEKIREFNIYNREHVF